MDLAGKKKPVTEGPPREGKSTVYATTSRTRETLVCGPKFKFDSVNDLHVGLLLRHERYGIKEVDILL